LPAGEGVARVVLEAETHQRADDRSHTDADVP
jgi:hypothetical protein